MTSIIIDVGSRYIRAGYSGEDKPTVVMTSHVGILPNDRRLYGDLALLTPQENMEIIPILSSTGSIFTRAYFILIISIGYGTL